MPMYVRAFARVPIRPTRERERERERERSSQRNYTQLTNIDTDR